MDNVIKYFDSDKQYQLLPQSEYQGFVNCMNAQCYTLVKSSIRKGYQSRRFFEVRHFKSAVYEVTRNNIRSTRFGILIETFKKEV